MKILKSIKMKMQTSDLKFNSTMKNGKYDKKKFEPGYSQNEKNQYALINAYDLYLH